MEVHSRRLCVSAVKLVLIIEELGEPFSIIATQRELGAVAKDHRVVAAEHRVKLLYAVDVYHRRAVDAEKLFRIELLFDAVHRLADHMRLAADMKLDVIAGSFDPIDLVGLEEEDASDGLHDQAIEVLFLAAKIRDERVEPLIEIAEPFVLD